MDSCLIAASSVLPDEVLAQADSASTPQLHKCHYASIPSKRKPRLSSQSSIMIISSETSCSVSAQENC
ncbi:hypothetical protein Q3G72_024216 [Acer saccharum]|nr:hypothetical protein Q3G72_024216 [Acer saccharum]